MFSIYVFVHLIIIDVHISRDFVKKYIKKYIIVF